MLKKILYGLLAVLLIIQFIRPAKNATDTQQEQDIALAYPVPNDIHATLRRACYDCHSNNTHYPWYYNFQPLAWWMAHHIDEGKRELNFSEFGSFTKKRKVKKLHEIADEVQEGSMPLESYTWIHGEAKLSKEEAAGIVAWANLLASQIEQHEDSTTVNP